MMKKRIRIILVILLFWGLHVVDAHADISISAKVDQHEVALADPFTLTITVVADGDGEDYCIKKFKLPDCYQIGILKSSMVSDTVKDEKGVKTISTFRIGLQAIKEGDGRIGYASIDYLEKGSAVDSTLRTDPIDIKIIPKEKKHVSLLKMIGGVAILLIIVFIVGIVVVDKFKKNKVS